MIGITKADQLKHNKKPKVSTFGKKKYTIKKKSDKNIVTKDEQKYMDHLDLIRNQTPCFVCGKNNYNDPIEWHHITDIKRIKGKRRSHFRLIPLCGIKCHRLGKNAIHIMPKEEYYKNIKSLEELCTKAKEFYVNFINNCI